MLPTHPIYRKLDAPVTLLGIELEDWFGLGVGFVVLSRMSDLVVGGMLGWPRAEAGVSALGTGLLFTAAVFLAVLLSVALSRAGFSPVAIGILITVSLMGDFVGTYLIGLFADRWGRRRVLSILALLMAATGLVFGLVTVYGVLLAAAFFGTLGTSASETAPFLPIEQAIAWHGAVSLLLVIKQEVHNITRCRKVAVKQETCPRFIEIAREDFAVRAEEGIVGISS